MNQKERDIQRKKSPYLRAFLSVYHVKWVFVYTVGIIGGEGGSRTPDTLACMPHFECGAIDHSATSPRSFKLWSWVSQ